MTPGHPVDTGSQDMHCQESRYTCLMTQLQKQNVGLRNDARHVFIDNAMLGFVPQANRRLMAEHLVTSLFREGRKPIEFCCVQLFRVF